MKILENKIFIIGTFILSFLIIISLGSYIVYLNNNQEINESSKEEVKDEVILEVKEEKEKMINVEVKGAVKTPGVYNVKDETIINEVIKLAGGFLKDSFTSNINLSKKLSDETVIFVFTKNEFKNSIKTTIKSCSATNYNINSCVKSGSSVITTNKNDNKETVNETEKKPEEPLIININTAGINDLTKLSGIGESKAKAIITYRTEKGLFKSIEDIKNVSGIGNATFEKLKKFITV